MDGLQLLESVRREGFDCAFIILTGYGDLPQALAARERFNISNFLVKPIHNMDQFLFDAGDDAVAVDDEVVLIGTQDGAAVTADDWAAWLDTINYEIVCTVGARVPRVYVGEGERQRAGGWGPEGDGI